MDDDERRELVRRLFFLMSSRLEEATTSAGAGQATDISSKTAAELAGRLHSTGQEIAIIADAVTLIAQSTGRMQ